MNLYLIGYRCSGKSTVGKILADRLRRRFVDTDREIVARTGKTIQQMVEADGWDGFREIERNVIAAIAGQSDLVVAAGGGAVLDRRNVAAMKKSGRTVWLEASPETVLSRMTADPTSLQWRPALTRESLFDEIRTTMAARHPVYRDAGDVHIDTENRDAAAICEDILLHLGEKGVQRT